MAVYFSKDCRAQATQFTAAITQEESPISYLNPYDAQCIFEHLRSVKTLNIICIVKDEEDAGRLLLVLCQFYDNAFHDDTIVNAPADDALFANSTVFAWMNGALYAILSNLPLETHPNRVVKFTRCGKHDWDEEAMDIDLSVPRCANLTPIAYEKSTRRSLDREAIAATAPAERSAGTFIIGVSDGNIFINDYRGGNSPPLDTNCAEWQRLIAAENHRIANPNADVEYFAAGVVNQKLFIFADATAYVRVVDATNGSSEVKTATETVYGISHRLATIGDFLFGIFRISPGTNNEYLARFDPTNNSWNLICPLNGGAHKPSSTFLAEWGENNICIVTSESTHESQITIEEFDVRDFSIHTTTTLPAIYMDAKLAFVS
ncbi:MAG: hypothetical protein M0R33_18990 [Methylomonas sp.]|jgi:hypothetical protein|uniref:hypothetical protein n=1 Tax=Methylomonas sp. TaxID=418 RepID=UPI0025D1036D|nr:hypothetical protein [Methylomonas sp.]MCK9608532.1 hypothetical protein [Methylomonas sp.]